MPVLELTHEQHYSPVHRLPAERLHVGDTVAAVHRGPKGTVTAVTPTTWGGWTIVDYGKGTVPYQHGKDSITLYPEVRA